MRSIRLGSPLGNHQSALSLAVLLLASALEAQIPAPRVSRGPSGIVAIVNQDVITRKELDRQVDMWMAEYAQARSTPLPVLEQGRPRIERGRLDSLIEESLLLQDAKKNGVLVTEEELDSYLTVLIEKDFRPKGFNFEDAEALYKYLKETYGYTREEYRDHLRRERIAARLLYDKYFPQNPFISPGRIRAEYKEHPERYELPGGVSFYIINIENGEDGKRTVEHLTPLLQKTIAEQKSPVDIFKEFARKAQGRELSLMNKNLKELEDWKPPLPQVLARMRKGALEGPVPIASGWAFIFMVDVKPGERIGFDKAQELIVRNLRVEENEEIKRRLIERLKKEAQIQDFLPPLPIESTRGEAKAAAKSEKGKEPDKKEGKVKDASEN